MQLPERNQPCWCGSGRKYKKCHWAFDEKLKMYENQGILVPSHELIKTPEQIEKIKESAKINIAILDYVADHIQEGVTTQEIDNWVRLLVMKDFLKACVLPSMSRCAMGFRQRMWR